MARVTLPAGIARISGKMGNYCFRTMKASGKVYMQPMPKQRHHVAPSEAVKMQRERFCAIAKMVQQMRQAGGKAKGKSQKTLWRLATEAYDAANK